MAVVPSPGIRVTVAEFLIRDLGRVSEWCDIWGMKLNASKTKTMIVSRSRTMHPQSPQLTIGGNVLKKSDDLVILGVTFDSKMTFEKHLRSVSRAASQRLGILRKSWRVFHDRLLQEQGHCFLIGLSYSIPTIVFYYFFLFLLSVYWLVLWGWRLRNDWVYITLSQPCTADLF